MAFESALDLASVSLRIPQSDMHRLPEILQAVPEELRQQMRHNLARVWQRWGGWQPSRRGCGDGAPTGWRDGSNGPHRPTAHRLKGAQQRARAQSLPSPCTQPSMPGPPATTLQVRIHQLAALCPSLQANTAEAC